MRALITALTVAFASVAGYVPGAFAQDAGVQLSAAVGGAFGADDSSAALNVAGATQLTTHAGVEVEVSYFPDQRFRNNREFVPQIFPAPPPGSTTTTGRTLAVLGSFVASLPRDRVRPYAQIGGGMANVRHRIHGGVAGPGGSLDPQVAETVFMTVSDTTPALSAGGGVEVRVWRHLAVGADVRYMRLLTEVRDLEIANLTRFGARLSYRF